MAVLRNKSVSLDEAGYYNQGGNVGGAVGGSATATGYSGMGQRSHNGNDGNSSGHHPGGYSSTGRLNNFFPSPSSPTQSRGLSNHSSPRGTSRVDLSLNSRNNSPVPSPMKVRQLPCSIYVVLYDFQQHRDDELGITAGSTVHILDTSDTEWWQGRCTLTGATGYLPASYLVRSLPSERVYRVNQRCSMICKTGELFNLTPDQIVLALPPAEGDPDIIVRTGEGGPQARRGRISLRCLSPI